MTLDKPSPLASQIKEMWRTGRPRAYRKLMREGRLDAEVARVAEEVAELSERLWKEGMPGPEAILEAESQLIHIPDI